MINSQHEFHLKNKNKSNNTADYFFSLFILVGINRNKTINNDKIK